jgi:hypothetical protein
VICLKREKKKPRKQKKWREEKVRGFTSSWGYNGKGVGVMRNEKQKLDELT